jgi:hypothetical protein
MALFVREFLASEQITVLEHQPYSLDRVPSDFLLSQKIKEILMTPVQVESESRVYRGVERESTGRLKLGIW